MMDLTVKDVACLLNVTELTVREWLDEGAIPAYQIGGDYRFHRPEIEDWVMQRHLTDEAGYTELNENKWSSGSLQFSLCRAINKGIVLQDVEGSNKEQVITNCVVTISEQLQLDADFITRLLLEREALQPTGLNHGIGVPHTRDFLLNDPFDVVTIAFLKRPLDYGSLDAMPVHTLFFLFACEDRSHLHLLAKIAHFSSDPQMRQLLESKPTKSALVRRVKDWEAKMPQGHLLGQAHS